MIICNIAESDEACGENIDKVYAVTIETCKEAAQATLLNELLKLLDLFGLLACLLW